MRITNVRYLGISTLDLVVVLKGKCWAFSGFPYETLITFSQPLSQFDLPLPISDPKLAAKCKNKSLTTCYRLTVIKKQS